ncbi:YheC/YheD family protein [Salipaludibacillus aurantiacus]|uniref:YheC/D like ATP-grasp n=1 Tax=Salipaludibacillus aurantiacus TaxID=1601833 RepID=A0A1H9V4G3_9BACI|nr:YheC/YheD family protein [Salipaludibacillus aurantiacus]SES16183.1 YheC/D like ATP-grasp [Salipaludibacillus aurantiacus]
MKVSVSKWSKYKLMKQNKLLADYLPETRIFKRDTLWSMLKRHKSVVIKPNFGRLGFKILKVNSLGDDHYNIHYGRKINHFTGQVPTLNYINQITKKKRVVQQYIPLATIDDAPFDFRIMLQRKKRTDDWFVTGTAAKVSFSGYFVTNASVQVLTVEEAINKSILKNKVKVTDLQKKLDSLGLEAARHLQKYFPKRTEIGLDVGIDEDGNLWIIEANYRPSINMFEIMQNQTFYKNIVDFRSSPERYKERKTENTGKSESPGKNDLLPENKVTSNLNKNPDGNFITNLIRRFRRFLSSE